MEVAASHTHKREEKNTKEDTHTHTHTSRAIPHFACRRVQSKRNFCINQSMFDGFIAFSGASIGTEAWKKKKKKAAHGKYNCGHDPSINHRRGYITFVFMLMGGGGIPAHQMNCQIPLPIFSETAGH